MTVTKPVTTASGGMNSALPIWKDPCRNCWLHVHCSQLYNIMWNVCIHLQTCKSIAVKLITSLSGSSNSVATSSTYSILTLVSLLE